MACVGSKDPRFTDEFLLQNGAPKGSRVIMTANAFMTDEAMDEIAVSWAQGLRALPVVCDHPTWWMTQTLDGFRSHKFVLRALRVFWEYKIMLPIEEGDNSQVPYSYHRYYLPCALLPAPRTVLEYSKI